MISLFTSITCASNQSRKISQLESKVCLNHMSLNQSLANANQRVIGYYTLTSKKELMFIQISVQQPQQAFLATQKSIASPIMATRQRTDSQFSQNTIHFAQKAVVMGNHSSQDQTMNSHMLLSSRFKKNKEENPQGVFDIEAAPPMQQSHNPFFDAVKELEEEDIVEKDLIKEELQQKITKLYTPSVKNSSARRSGTIDNRASSKELYYFDPTNQTPLASQNIIKQYQKLKKQKQAKKKKDTNPDESSLELNQTMLDSKSKKWRPIANAKASMIERTLDFELPKVNKNDLKFLEQSQQTIGRDQTEVEIQQWITSFIQEVDRIEAFFKKNLRELKREFKNLENQYNSNNQVDEMGNIVPSQRKTQERSDSNNITRFDTNDSIQIYEISEANGNQQKKVIPQQHQQVPQPSLFKQFSNPPTGYQPRVSIKDALLQQRSPINQKQYETLRISQRLERETAQPLLTQGHNSEGKASTKERRPSTNTGLRKTVYDQRVGKIKDELEYATNWRRAFIQLFTRLKWLNAYAQINYIAIQRSLKKFMKSYFAIEDNIIDKKLQRYVDERSFTSKKNVKYILQDLIDVVAVNFTNQKYISFNLIQLTLNSKLYFSTTTRRKQSTYQPPKTSKCARKMLFYFPSSQALS